MSWLLWLAPACTPQAANRTELLDGGGHGGTGGGGSAGSAGQGGQAGSPAGDDAGDITAADGSATDDADNGGDDADNGDDDAEVVAPPFNSSVASDCAAAKTWMAGTDYSEGDAVVHGTPARKFTCKPWPYTPWCSESQYEPGVPSLYWSEAWNDDGACP